MLLTCCRGIRSMRLLDFASSPCMHGIHQLTMPWCEGSCTRDDHGHSFCFAFACPSGSLLLL
jgi:hypothetical protein